MSHELTEREDGFVEMAYLNSEGVPWHKLGQAMAEDATVDEWIVQSGMDFRIQQSKIRFATSRDTSEPLSLYDDSVVLFRSDSKKPLSIVGRNYKVVQPRDFFEIMRGILPHGFKLSAAGTLFGGRRYWVTASIGANAAVLDKDVINGYLLLVTSADGTLRTIGKYCATRAVCDNTVTMALGEKGKRTFELSHKTELDAAALKAQLGIVHGAFDRFILQSRKLALTTCNIDEAKKLTAELLVDSKTVTKQDVTASSGYKSILSLFDHGKGNHGETLWDWTNGVSEWVDHVQRASSDSHRMNNALYGRGDALKTQAFEKALQLAD